MHNITKFKVSELGFTLVEMLVAMVIAVVVGTGIMSLYVNSSKTYETQTLVAETQQNSRAGLAAMTWDIRMAGYDPSRDSSDAGVIQATATMIRFKMDLNDDGDTTDTDEDIAYAINGSGNLGRNSQPVSENTTALGFAYAYADTNGELTTYITTSGNEEILWAIPDPGGGGTWVQLEVNAEGTVSDADNNGTIALVDTTTNVDFEDIRLVKSWLLSEAKRQDRAPATNQTYIVGNQIVTRNDSVKRRLLTTTVSCRNMGI